MLQFAMEELVLPDGPHKGAKWKPRFQPYGALWLSAIDSGLWSEYWFTGPVQSGKTLHGLIIPVMYHLFEYGETVILAAPTDEIAAEKWHMDLLPAIQSSRFDDLLPDKGAGSQGGKPSLIRFKNGASLKTMTGGGGDEKRSAFTSRVVCITEVDKMDETGGSSRETDKISQIIARTAAFGDRARIYGECTVSTEKGRIWQEYLRGTQSRIACQCEACGKYVTPEREQFVGWDGASTEIEAEKMAAVACPNCGILWSMERLIEANRTAILLHDGQDVDEAGNITGAIKETRSFSMRANAANNMFVKPPQLGRKHWNAARKTDQDSAEKELRQFLWAIPVESEKQDKFSLEMDAIITRQHEESKGAKPAATECVTIGMDVGHRLCWWLAIAWQPDGSGCVVGYGMIETMKDDLGTDIAIQTAVEEWIRTEGIKLNPDLIYVDSSAETQTVYKTIRRLDDLRSPAGTQLVWPLKGHAEGQRNYRKPQHTNKDTVRICEEHHFQVQEADGIILVEPNVDYWKTRVHKALMCPMDQQGALTLYADEPKNHQMFGRHVLAEKQVELFDPDKGMVTKWERLHKNNHLFDCAAYAMCGGSTLGYRQVIRAQAKPVQSSPTQQDQEGLFVWQR